MAERPCEERAFFSKISVQGQIWERSQWGEFYKVCKRGWLGHWNVGLFSFLALSKNACVSQLEGALCEIPSCDCYERLYSGDVATRMHVTACRLQIALQYRIDLHKALSCAVLHVRRAQIPGLTCI